ncbi:MAG: glycosyltransferase family 2 protein [Planctomycetes bacterium]|nr:glycosyltransferase family 2 protein [Planctomycetota bacterium]
MLSVLMPAYNEENTIDEIVQKVLTLPMLHELIIVNDCSSDRTAEIVGNIDSERIQFLTLDKNSGKTAAIKKAIEHASGEIIIIQDADLEYDPSEIPSIIDPIINGHADVVYGSRFLVRKATRVLYFYHFLGNKVLTFLSNMLTNLNMTDMETCYKAMRAPILKNMPISSKGFGMEVEITAMIGKLSLRVYEVPISYYGRTYEDGKKIGIRDGIHALWYLLYYNIVYPRKKICKEYLKTVTQELDS